MNPVIYAVGSPLPSAAVEGLRINAAPPLVIVIGIPNPTPTEIDVIRCGRIIHQFGYNHHTAWMTLHFYDRHDVLQFQGEVFHCAGKAPNEYAEKKLAALREQLPEEVGLSCTLLLVNTIDQRIAGIRLYAWSRELSLAFLDAAEITRHASSAEADIAAQILMRHPTDELAEMAGVAFMLPGNQDD